MRYIGFLICMLLQGCSSAAQVSSPQVCIHQHCFDVEVVQKQEEMMKGLQLRNSMLESHGMLFVFPDSSKHSFWMKDTLISLDMIWFDYSRRIVYIAHNVPPCKADPCPTYTPTSEALYVLEVNANATLKLDIKEGDVAEFKLTVPGTYKQLN